MTDPHLFLSRLEKVRQTGSESWMACCPAHNDRDPSLSIGISKRDGRLLFQCFAGCEWKHILDAIGLSLDDVQEGPIADRLMGGNKRAYEKRSEEKLEHELRIIMLGKSDMESGKRLSSTDLARFNLAIQRVKRGGV